jgi:SSS family transporter
MTGIDWLILFAYLAGLLAVALRASRRDGSPSSFFLADRRMPALAVGLSVMATAFSATNYVALPSEVAAEGLYVLASLPAFVLVAPLINRVVIPFFRGMQLPTAYSFLELRFDGRVRVMATLMFLFWRWLWLSAALLALGAMASHLAQLPPLATIVVVGLIATAYTSWGGLRAIMWTDVLQFAVILASIALLTGAAAAQLPDGLADILTTAHRDGRLKPASPFDPTFLSLDPTRRITLLSGLVGTMVVFIGRYGADQVMMQRYLAARSTAIARRGMWLNVAAALLALTLLACFGLVVHAYLAHGVATLPAEGWKPGRMLAAVVSELPRGWRGLVLAGLAAATLSSVDSGINACAATILHDLRTKPADVESHASAGQRRLASILCGLAIIVGAVLLAWRNQNLFELANRIVNALGSPLLAIMALAMFSRRANSTGMLVGGTIGLVVSLYVSWQFNKLALHYYAVGNLALTLAACLIASEIAHRLGHVNTPQQLQWTWQARRHLSET